MSRSKKLDAKRKKREAETKRRLDRKRRAAAEQARIDNWKPKEDSINKKPVPFIEPLTLEQDAPMPPRNGPCPLHPEHKLKRCPHGCLSLFRDNRSRVANDAVHVVVRKDDKRAGRVGYEDGAVSTARQLVEKLKEDEPDAP